MIHSKERIYNPHEDDQAQMKGSNIPTLDKTSRNSQSPSSNRSLMKIQQSVHSYGEEDDSDRDPMDVIVPMKRRRSFLPTTAHSRSRCQSTENIFSSPGRQVKPTYPVFEIGDENGNDIFETNKLQLPAKRRNSFMAISLRGVSMSPKPSFKKTLVSYKTAKPPLLRALSYSASTDTCNTEISHSDHTRSTTSSPTSSSSDSQEQTGDQNVETESLMEANHFVSIFDLDKSSRSTVSSHNYSAEGGCLKERHETNMSLLRSMSLVVGMFLLHYVKVIGLTLNLRTILARIWMTLFDIMVEAVSITMELMSYAIPIILRLFETSMLWFVQQVYIRRVFILLYDTFKNRKKCDVAVDHLASTNEPISSPTEKGTRRPMRFLNVSKDTVRRKSIRIGSFKD
jgi:hypothetical protein